MQQTMLPEETRNVRKNRSRVHRWIAGGMSCVMSLCTVLSLVAPAFAQENETAAEPHTHTEACYQQVTEKTGKTLSCDALSLAYDGADGETADFVVHAHSGLCYDETGALVCTLPEKEAHTHGDGCYTAADTHIHGDSCYDMDADPTCGKTAHTHSDACYTCAQEGEEGHTHNDTCRTLTCTAEEHTHEAACYPLTCTQSTESAKLTCTKEEVILHTHGDACYETYTDETGAEQKRLTCTQQEIKEHVHTDACFTTTTEPVDTTALTCTEDHEHTALCYGTWELVCGLEETVAGDATNSTETEAVTLTGVIYTDSSYKTVASEDVIITVTGVIPSGAKVCAYPITVEPENGMEVLCAYDIEILLEDGTVFEPAEGESLTVDIQSDVLKNTHSDMYVYHVPESGEREKVTTTETDKGIAFDAKHFSPYAIMTASTVDRRDGGIPVYTGDNIRFNLFDYSKYINKTESNNNAGWRANSDVFGFRGTYTNEIAEDEKDSLIKVASSDYDVDGFTKNHATVQRTLTNGTGLTQDTTRDATGATREGTTNYSLDYLFQSGDHAVTAYSPTNTILQNSGNRYWYNSATNATDYSNGQFYVRNYTDKVNRGTNDDDTVKTSSDFLPFNYTNGTIPLETSDINYWFGMTMEFSFVQTPDGKIDDGDMIFKFSGDDDVWVFVDDTLVLDLGGTHGTVYGEINFATGKIKQYLTWEGAAETDTNTSFSTTLQECFTAAETKPKGGWKNGNIFNDYTTHTLKFYYMERATAYANCMIDFTLETVPDNSLTVTKKVAVEEGTFIDNGAEYQFKVVKVDEKGKPTGDLYIPSGKTFVIKDASGNVIDDAATVGEGGIFTLKAGQSAVFSNMLDHGKESGNYGYKVVEILDSTQQERIAKVKIDNSEVTGTTAGNNKEYASGELQGDSVESVVFTNVPNLGKLEITKSLTNYDSTDKTDPEFTVKVSVQNGNEWVPIPSETKYSVSGTTEEQTVGDDGTVKIKNGKTVTISNIMLGASCMVEEVNTDGYVVTYTPGQIVTITSTSEPVTVAIGNEEKGIDVLIPVTKKLSNPDNEAHEYNFQWVELVLNESTNEFTSTGTAKNFTIMLPANDGEENYISANDINGIPLKFTLKMLVNNAGETVNSKDFYYQIKEVTEDSAAVDADQTVYVVKVTVTRDNSKTGGLEASKTVYKMTDKELTSPQEGESVTFSNTLLGALEIEKDLILLSGLPDADKAFKVKVELTGDLLKKGMVLSEGTIVETDGSATVEVTVKDNGSKVTIGEIPAGTKYKVTEAADSAYGYAVSYGVQNGEGTITAKADGKDNASVVITNKELKAELEIPVLKKLTNPDGKEHTYAFKLTQVEVDKDGNVLSYGETQNASVTMKEDEASAKFVLTYKGTDLNGESTRTYYYLVKETTKSDLYLDADVSTFLLEVKLSGGDNQLTAKVVSVNKQSVSGETPVLTFTNTLLGTITLEKTLVGATHVGPFTFDLTGKIADGDYYAVRNGEDKEVVTFKNGKATVKLMLNDTLTIYGIPHGTAITIQEYVGADEVRYTINGSIWKHSGYTAETEVTTSGTTVRYINYYYGDLPQTGQLNWPILLLAVLGVGCLGAGAFLRFRRKKGKYE